MRQRADCTKAVRPVALKSATSTSLGYKNGQSTPASNSRFPTPRKTFTSAFDTQALNRLFLAATYHWRRRELTTNLNNYMRVLQSRMNARICTYKYVQI
jgi:hypothetical protein